jgi:hypothetical protein
MNKVFDIQDGAHLMTNLGAIVMGYASGLINEQTHYRLAFRTGDFGMHQLDSLVDGRLLGDLAHPLCNRPWVHDCLSASRELALPLAQKKKWAKTHRTNPKIRASCGLYEKDRAEASEGQGSGDAVSNRRSAEHVVRGRDGQPFPKPPSGGFPEGLLDRAFYAP